MADGMIGHGSGDAAIPEIKGALVGFRRWTLRGDKLGAPHIPGTYWEPGVNTATCKNSGHEQRSDFKARELFDGVLSALMGGHVLMAGEQKTPEPIPHKNCTCGMYAYHRPNQLGNIDSAAGSVYGEVAGACLLWGRIEVHQTGFRAERALPILLVHSTPPTHLRGIIDRSRYGSWDEQLKAVATRYQMSMVEPDKLLQRASQLGRLYTDDLYNDGV